MTSIQDMIAAYKRDHQHPVNRALHTIGIPMILASLAVVFFAPWYGAVLFAVGWLFQFTGHAFEGKWPSFFRDPKFLLVGATWFAQRVRTWLSAARPVSQ